MLAEQPCYLVLCKMHWWRWHTEKSVAALQAQLNEVIGYPLRCGVICVTKKNAELFDVVRRVPNALFYVRRRYKLQGKLSK